MLAIELGGFAQLAQRLDPEDLRSIVDMWVARTSEHVRSFDGTVAVTTDHSILAVFGAPDC